ncbi:hypothetical protein [Heyndrickxia oleronia]|uniref:hypothetical protein n=1 Tax=Heyndrickxia oleronia TaxID=38875 RepID=UPI001C0F1C50|nr:hypothetical protein [Heyndrickxia oleronia]MBU5214556.1 hypothetical protein [Heyndrickxia oleronia]
MTEKFSFFDSILADTGEYDREYNAQEFTDYFATLVTTGVMKGAGNELKVTANGSNMLSSLDTGIAFIEGRYYSNLAKLDHTHDTEVVGKNRIDRIVVRLDLNTESRFVKSFIKKGVPAIVPVAPALQRDQFIYEISLAQVKIIGGQTYINANDMIDERGKTDICPWAGSKILPNFDNEALEEHIHDYIEHTPLVRTTGKSDAYEVTLEGVTEYQTGLSLAIQVHVANTRVPTLNINGLGPKAITTNGDLLEADVMLGNGVYTLRYNGNNFLLQGYPSEASTTKRGVVVLSNEYNVNEQNKAATTYALYRFFNLEFNNYKFIAGGGNKGSGGVDVVVIGRNSKVVSDQSIAIGYNTKAEQGVDTIAIGTQAVAGGGRDTWDGEAAIAIGKNSSAPQGRAIAIGKNAKTTGSGHGIAIGAETTAFSSAVAIGVNSIATGGESVAFGGISNANWNQMLIGTRIFEVVIAGNLRVTGSKNFEIAHPKLDKKDTHVIRHGAVESPTTGDTLYRYSVKIQNNKAKVMLFGENNEMELPITEEDGVYLISIPLPDYFVHLNINEQIFVNANKHFGLGYGEINRETETLELTLNSLKDYNVMVLGTRNDDDVQEWYIKGVEREIGESWLGEVYVFEVPEIIEVLEFGEDEKYEYYNS